VFDETLKLNSFGAKLRARLTSDSIPVVDARGSKVDDLLLRTKGTRHQSAAALVQQVESATVIVLSQDGGARVFRRENGKPCVSPECAVDASIFAPG
jgi:hypothetical protein